MESLYQKDVQEKLSRNVDNLVKAIENEDKKRLTNTPHLDQEDLVILDYVDKALVEEMAMSDAQEQQVIISQESHEKMVERSLIRLYDMTEYHMEILSHMKQTYD
ncbi:hypothetical protein TSUD_374930 [Trifolium subterraneum]|uniref:Uncharacterized protein n=1 Tax=Trifolium subterraneum TaxID=3900 RepID=A0A2Z6NW50_TRISU|nr:hypothetical protein TSUD_374930 [Trifolium subterraneum]